MQAPLLSHPATNAPVALVCDASDFAVGAVFQQIVDDAWQPLGYFSKKMSTAERKYSAYDRAMKLLNILDS